MKRFLALLLGILIISGCSNDGGAMSKKDRKVSVGGEEVTVPIINEEIVNITYEIPEAMVLPEILQEDLKIQDAPENAKHYLFRFPYEVTGNTTNSGEDALNFSVMNEDGVIFDFMFIVFAREILEEYFGERLYVEFYNTSPATKSSRFEVFTIADKFVEAGGEWDLIFREPGGTMVGIKPLGKIFD